MPIIVNNAFIRVMGAWIGSAAVVQEGLSLEYRLHDQRQLWTNLGEEISIQGEKQGQSLPE